jgi:hypothetical protein
MSETTNIRTNDAEIRALNDAELDAVVGGAMAHEQIVLPVAGANPKNGGGSGNDLLGDFLAGAGLSTAAAAAVFFA